jgi:hypothetical protein
MSWRSWTLFAMTGLCLVVQLEARAQQNYTFRKVVELSDGYDDLASRPAINNNGTVVFGARRGNQQGIFTITSGGVVKPIALIGEPFAAFSKLGGIDVGEPDINDSDRVAFYASTGGDAGIFTSDGTTTTTIARTGSLGLSTGDLKSRVSINNSGVVAFSTGRPFATSAVHAGNGSVIVTIDSNGTNPTINNSGNIAYVKRGVNFQEDARIVTSLGRKIAVVHDSDVQNTFPFINDLDEVAFQGRVSATNRMGVFVGLGVPLNSKFTPSVLLVANGEGLVSEPGLYGKLTINDNGTVVFWSNTAGEMGGIFTGDHYADNRVIAAGYPARDKLSGGSVEIVEFSPHGLNDLGQIVFYVQYIKMVNGGPVNSRAIFIATPGELPPG